MATSHFSNYGQRIDPNHYRSLPAGTCCSEKNVGNVERTLSLALGAGLGVAGLSQGRLKGLALIALGAGLIRRGYTGHCGCYAALGIDNAERNLATAVPAGQGIKIEKTIIVERPASDLYRFWRRLENLPQVMRHLKRVRSIDSQHSRWVAEGRWVKTSSGMLKSSTNAKTKCSRGLPFPAATSKPPAVCISVRRAMKGPNLRFRSNTIRQPVKSEPTSPHCSARVSRGSLTKT